MPKRLMQEQVEQYRKDGFVGSIPVLTQDEVKQFRSSLEGYERQTQKAVGFPEKSKPYLLFDWADAIVHHPLVLDAVEDVIGPDILVYHTTLWTKEPGAETFVIWHQDDAYFHLDPAEQVTAWVALTEASVEAGCMRMVPESHKLGYLDHTDNPHEKNIVRRGLGIHGRYGPNDGVHVPLHAGEMSLHNTHTAHSSNPNRSNDRRIGLGVSFIPTHVKPKTEPHSSALLVRGEDRYHHFHKEERLREPLSAEAREKHLLAYRRYIAATRIPEGG
jgi:non-heme Fe2+,alpha-ketoglutarate-dependent halogenase